MTALLIYSMLYFDHGSNFPMTLSKGHMCPVGDPLW